MEDLACPWCPQNIKVSPCTALPMGRYVLHTVCTAAICGSKYRLAPARGWVGGWAKMKT